MVVHSLMLASSPFDAPFCLVPLAPAAPPSLEGWVLLLEVLASNARGRKCCDRLPVLKKYWRRAPIDHLSSLGTSFSLFPSSPFDAPFCLVPPAPAVPPSLEGWAPFFEVSASNVRGRKSCDRLPVLKKYWRRAPIYHLSSPVTNFSLVASSPFDAPFYLVPPAPAAPPSPEGWAPLLEVSSVATRSWPGGSLLAHRWKESVRDVYVGCWLRRFSLPQSDRTPCNCNIKGHRLASSVADCCCADIYPVPRSSWDAAIAYQFQVVWSDSCHLDLSYKFTTKIRSSNKW